MKLTTSTIMPLSYLLMIIGLFSWNWGMIIFFSIFTLGIPLFFLALPIVGFTIPQAKSPVSLTLRSLCSFSALIPLVITITSLPLRTTTTESGNSIGAAPWIAPLIIVSGIVFLFSSIRITSQQYKLLRGNQS